MIGRPAVGLIALTVTFLGQPLARAVNRVLLAWLDDWAIVGFAGLGVVGIFVVATHLTAQENRASVAGFIGGLLIWRGFFRRTATVFRRLVQHSTGRLRWFPAGWPICAPDVLGDDHAGNAAVVWPDEPRDQVPVHALLSATRTLVPGRPDSGSRPQLRADRGHGDRVRPVGNIPSVPVSRRLARDAVLRRHVPVVGCT